MPAIAALLAYDDDPLYIGSIYLADVVEARVRSGDHDRAGAALARLTDRALASPTPWALGLLARARALLAAHAEAEVLHHEALDHQGPARRPVPARARAQRGASGSLELARRSLALLTAPR